MICLSPIPARAIAKSIPLPSLVHKVASQPSAGWCQRRLRKEPGCSYWPVVPSSPSPLHSISGDHMRSLSFHPYPAAIKQCFSSTLGWYQRRLTGELELSCLHDVNGSHVYNSSKVPPCIQGGIRGGFMESWNVHLHPAVIRSEAKWRT